MFDKFTVGVFETFIGPYFEEYSEKLNKKFRYTGYEAKNTQIEMKKS